MPHVFVSREGEYEHKRSIIIAFLASISMAVDPIHEESFRRSSRECVDTERFSPMAITAGLMSISNCVYIIIRPLILDCL